MQITFIGGGHMATAIIAGLSKNPDHTIRVLDRNQDKLDKLAAEYGIQGVLAMPAQFTAQDVVVLAVKPQQLKVLCKDLAPRLGDALVISVASGLRCEALSHWLSTKRLVRAMPNTPAMVSKGITGLFAEPSIGQADREIAQIVLAVVGEVLWLDEEAGIDDITCISGSGPAYVFYFIESMMQAARKVGFDEEKARALVLGTFEGAVALARQSSQPIEVLRSNVTSKGGTTERAIARFEQEGVKPAIIAGALDCRARSIEMGQQLSQD